MFIRVFLALVLLGAGFAKCQPADPVAFFSFDRGKLESSGRHIFEAKKYGTLYDQDRFGNPNSSIFLQGNFGSFLNLGSDAALKPDIGSLSIWFKIAHVMHKGEGVENNPLIMTRATANEDYNEAYYIGCDMNTTSLGSCLSLDANKQISLFLTSRLNIDQWRNVVITYDDSFFCLYLDGVLEAKAAKNFRTAFLKGDSIIVGNRISRKNKRVFNGSVDDIAIYDRVLSPQEVTELFNAPNPNKQAVILRAAGIILFSLAGLLLIFLLIRYRVKKIISQERTKLNKAYEQEIRVLKAQMNPHFIFNSLNSILQFIITNENEKAQIYLTKFAKLVRKLLETNTTESIGLNDEIFILNSYLELESLRFNNVFSYEIDVKEGIDAARTMIPHFLLQPFVENAIWHGLLRKKGEKKLLVRFESKSAEVLSCTIDDNGIGRKEAENSRVFEKGKSLAIAYVRQRLELLAKLKKADLGVEIIDKTDGSGKSAGTTVRLAIPVTNY